MGNYVSYVRHVQSSMSYVWITPANDIDFDGAIKSLFPHFVMTPHLVNKFIFISDHGMPMVTPICFAYDRQTYTWTWSPDMINFMNIDTETVTDGIWKDRRPHESNVEIIRSLKKRFTFSWKAGTIFSDLAAFQKQWFMANIINGQGQMMAPWSVSENRIERRILGIKFPGVNPSNPNTTIEVDGIALPFRRLESMHDSLIC